MEVVSKNKKCMRTKIREKELEEYIDKVIPQRLFLPSDVIQIQINNKYTSSHCVQLRPIDLPLTTTSTYTHYAQIGATSQLKLTINFRQSEKLMKELDAARELDLTDQGGGKDQPVGETAQDAKVRAAKEIVTAYQ